MSAGEIIVLLILVGIVILTICSDHSDTKKKNKVKQILGENPERIFSLQFEEIVVRGRSRYSPGITYVQYVADVDGVPCSYYLNSRELIESGNIPDLKLPASELLSHLGTNFYVR